MALIRHLAGQPVPEVPAVMKALVDGRAFRATICSEVTFTYVYYVSFLGTPSTTYPWMLQSGGTIWR